MDKQKRILLNGLDVQIKLGNVTVNVLNANYEPPVPMRYFNTHSHSSYEFHFVPQGKGSVRIGKDTYGILPGTFYLTGPGVYHEQLSDGEDPMVEYCLNIELKPSEKRSRGKVHYPAQETQELVELLMGTRFWMGEDPYASWQLIEKVFEEYENPMLGYCRTIENLISQLLVNAIRCFSGHRAASYRQRPPASGEKRRRVMDEFFRDFEKPLKPEVLAQRLGVGVRQVERLVRQYYQTTFKGKIVKTRLEVAKDLLQNTSLTVDQIAFKTGFSSSSHFSKVFKGQEGSTPSAFRRSV